MKTLALRLFSIALALSTVESIASSAIEKMDLTDHNAVIEKLEIVLPKLDEPKKLNLIQLRLADLYADRARILEVKAGEQNCADCRDFKSDRLKAIALYEKAVSKADLEQQKKGYLQLGHLYMVTNHKTKATQLFNGVTRNKKLSSIHPKAYLGLAEIQFSNNDFKTAYNTFNKAERKAAKEDQAYITYRKAWSQLNIGNQRTALSLIQKSIRQASSPDQVSFRKDLMRDYATILAKNPFGPREVQTFSHYSPENDRAENLKYLGEEADRLGNKKGALLIWSRYSAQDEATKSKAEFNLKMAMNHYDLNQTAQALQFMEKATVAIKKANCDDCKTTVSNFRAFIVNWNKKEKSEPSNNLVRAYSFYLDAAPEDFEALIWAAQIAQQRNDSATAFRFYDRAAVVAHKQGKAAEAEKFSSIAMEVADSTGNDGLREQSFKRYLELNPKGPKRFLARYQIAYLAYKRKQFDNAVHEFKSLALEKDWKDTGIKIQAADLNLDILASQKKDKDVRNNAREFAQAFKTKLAHFTEIGRKVTINILVKLVADKDSSRSEIRSEIDTLNSYSIKHLSNEEKITQYRNIALAAEKISDIGTVQTASLRILSTRGASPSDIEFAWKSLLWVAELQLDFNRAYDIAKKMKMSNHTAAEKELRLGLLAELAGKNPTEHFNRYVKMAGVNKKSNELRVKLVKRSSNKWSALKTHMAALKRTPDILASITLELHLTSSNERVVNQVLKARGVNRTAEGQYLIKLKNRNENSQFLAQVRKANIDRTSDRAIQRSMKRKISLLEQLKRRYDSALRSGDLVLQASLLSAIEKENRSFFSQIQRLPIPRGLRPQERLTYKNLIDQQSKPFLTIADEAKASIEKRVTDNDKAMNELEAALQSSDTLQRRLAMNELKSLRPYMTKSQIRSLENANRKMQVSNKQVNKVRQEIRINPLNTSVLAELRELEARRANGPLIAYLDQRIEQLKTERRR